MGKHAALYMRVSTAQQTHQSQEPALQQWAEAHGMSARWYRDTGTGRVFDRPGWNQLEADVRANKISSVVVFRFDRLGRLTRELLRLVDELRERKVNLVSITEGFDLNTAAGRKFVRDLASAAEYESEVLAERIRAGQAAARAKGVTWGGSVAGKRKKVSATVERMIRQLRGDGESVAAIATATKLSRPTIYDVLRCTTK